MTDHSTSTTHLTVPPEPAPQCISLVGPESVTVRYTGPHKHVPDTGIFIGHPEFEGRAKFGATL